MPGKSRHHLAQLVDQPRPCPAGAIPRAGLSTRKVSVSFRPIGSRPSSSEPARATMPLHLGHALEDRAAGCARSAGDALLQADRRQLLELHDQVAFVHRRHEGLADQRCRRPRRRRARRQRRDDHDARPRQRPVERRRVQPRAPCAPATGRRGAPSAQQVRGQHRNHGQRQQQRAGQREHDGQRHRHEQLAFQPLQRQQRQEHDDDDRRCRRRPARPTSRTAR